MATNKKFRIQNGANIEGELSIGNVTVIGSDGLVAAASVEPAVQSIVDTSYVNALNVTAFSALSAETVTDISSFSTTDIPEGSNQYFTPQRARDAVQAGEGMSYNGVTGEFSVNLTGGDGVSVSGGTVSIDGSSIGQDLVPAVDNIYSLGSPDKVWRDVYIGPGSLYINGTKILEDNSGTITMYADPGQNLAFGVTAGGSIDFNAGEATIDFKSDVVMLPGKTITTSGGAATVFGGDVNLSGNNLCDIAAPTTGTDAVNRDYVDNKISGTHVGNKEFGGSVTVQGDLTVQGTTTTVNSQTLSIADNIIDLNSDVVTGTPTENAGIRVMRGDESAAQMRWNEALNYWEVYDGSVWTKVALSTSDLAEGSNKYFTDERVNAIVGPIEGALQDADSAEQAARIAGDAAVQSAVDAEQASRIAGDAAVQSAVDAEQAARIAGDAVVQSAIAVVDGKVEAILGTSPETLNTLQEIVAAFEGVDSDLSDVITSNSSRLSTAESKVGVLESGMVSRISEIGNINTKDAQQDSRLDGHDADLSGLSGRLDSDRLEWIGSDAALGGRVSTLENEMDVVEGRLDSDRLEWVAADTGLDAKIDSETARATGVEAGLQSQITNILSNTDQTALNSLSEIVAEFQSVDGTLVGLINSNAADISTLETDVTALQAINAGGRLTTAEGTLVSHNGRITTLESSMTQAQQDIIDLPGQIKGDLVGGLCITFDPVTGVIAIDETEVRSQLITHDADNLGGNDPAYYRINVYRVDGTLVN